MSSSNLDLLGVNLSGAEFGSVGQAYGTGYTYPTHAEIDYEAASGMNVIRLPFLWERLQPTLKGALDPAELARMDDIVSYATGKGLKVDLDLHNYGSYAGQQVGSAAVPNAAFADLWGKLAAHFKANGSVMFGLMNEPQQSSAAGWLDSVNAAVSSIRATGATQEILVPGIGWDGAWTWTTGQNAAVIGSGVRDPLNNYAFEVHQYLDSDGSGTHQDVVSPTIGSQRLAAVTSWAQSTGHRLFMGEFGVAKDATSVAALGDMLSSMSQHADVWQGGTYWAAGPWWGTYMYSAEPANGQDTPQMKVLEQYEHKGAAPSTNVPPATSPATPVPASPAPVAQAPTTTTVGSGPDTLTLLLSEDAYQGNAQYTVSIDGKQVGGTLTATAAHGSGQHDTLTLGGDWSAGSHTVAVAFLNDAYGGSSSTDRNLYVEGATYDGAAVAGSQLSLQSAGTQSFAYRDVGTPTSAGTVTAVGSGPDQLTLLLSEDAYGGDAQYTVSVDGQQVGGTLTAKAAHASGLHDALTVNGNWGAGDHAVAVAFLNDAYGGTSSTDRNLYLDSATYDGASVAAGHLSLASSGSQSFAVHDDGKTSPAGISTTVGSGTDQLVLLLSEDPYQGDAQYTVSVDGKQIGGTLTTTANHGSGKHDTLTIDGSWTKGNHAVSVNFLNDAYGGSSGTDRNLYVEGASFDGTAVPNGQLNLASAGSQSLAFRHA